MISSPHQNPDPASVVKLKPGDPVVRLFFKDAKPYWCKGYKIYSPRLDSKGEVLKCNVKATGGKRLVVRETARNPYPVAVRHGDLKPFDPKAQYWTFAEVFGTASSVGLS